LVKKINPLNLPKNLDGSKKRKVNLFSKKMGFGTPRKIEMVRKRKIPKKPADFWVYYHMMGGKFFHNMKKKV